MKGVDGDVWFEEVDGKTELVGKGWVCTDENCTHCHKVFRMRVNFDVNGEHKINCPHCGHAHYRVIKDGTVTDKRWSSSNKEGTPPDGSFWQSDTIEARSTAAHTHIRNRFHGHD